MKGCSRRIINALCAVLIFSSASAPGQTQLAPPGFPANPEETHAVINWLENVAPKIPDRGAVLYTLAKLYARAGDNEKARALLKKCATFDEGFEPTNSPSLQTLKSSDEFRQLGEQARRRYPEVHQAKVAFTISERDLFPEGLAADTERRLFYLGSMYHKKIVRVTESDATSDFVKGGAYDLGPVGGIKIEMVDHSIWAVTDPSAGQSSELVHFDAEGKLIERFSAPNDGPHDFNDLVLVGARDLYITDTLGHRVYRFDRRAHQLTPLILVRPLFLPNGIAISDDGHLLFVADAFGVVRFDLADGASREVRPGRANTLAGIDGLYWFRGGLIGVQGGTDSYRVARFRLSSDGKSVRTTEILEHRTPLVRFPTTGALVREKFYFMANTGIDNLNEGTIVDPTKLEPIQIGVVSLE